jgi:Uma2 family endonuclease
MNIALRWTKIIHDPILRDLPYKIELNKLGQILMSPASNWHGYTQGEITGQFRNNKKGGKVITECSILTRDGVKVADVAWASDEFIENNGFKTPYLVAPEICVEILSPGNSIKEIADKVGLYLEKGAIEVWVIDSKGKISYFNNAGRVDHSKIIKGVKI